MNFEQEKEQDTSENQNPKNKKKVVWGLDIRSKNQKNKSNENNKKSTNEPIMMRNHLIFNNFKEKPLSDGERLAIDLNSRPSEPTSENYAAIPVSEFGAAMLRGMGWNENFQKSSSDCGVGPVPIKYVTRPERLGLGASEVKDFSELKKRKPIEQSLGIELTEEEEKQIHNKEFRKKPKQSGSGKLELPIKHSNYIGIDESDSKKMKLDVSVGTKVVIISGEHCDLKGIIKRDDLKSKNIKSYSNQITDLSSNFWIVELQISGECVKVPKSSVRIYDPLKDTFSSSMLENFEERSGCDNWACPGLIVRIKSKSTFMNGRYYNRKGIILDVKGDLNCTIKMCTSSTESNNRSHPTILSNVSQTILETCLPRSPDSIRPTVKYLRKDKGLENFQAPFRILKFDEEKETAVIQADDDFELIFEAHFADICEFIVIN